ncbi:MAG: triose-phosphate isomerase [Magnetococcales bacterium]|nr:triose-phosphate isomerase [Magnetococcales bacterium]
MRRRPLIAGNWKMNGLIETAQELVEGIGAALSDRERERKLQCEVLVCPPFTAIHTVHQTVSSKGYSMKVGGQNMDVEGPGARTGEICGIMLRNVGCRYVILGHSERRQFFGETNEIVGKKVEAAFRDGLVPIVCVGEELKDREAGRTIDVIRPQLEAVMPRLPEEASKRSTLVVAYEPVWAIGTGKNATPEQVQEVHAFIRKFLTEKLGADTASKIRILYGGSMKPANAAGLLALEDVDGGLIGGAALKAQDFLAIIDANPASD